MVETPELLKARLKKAPEKPKEEPKPEPKKTKVRIPKAKKYEDLPEIPDYERPDLEIYEKTDLDEKEKEKKAFEPPQIREPDEETLKEVEAKRKGSYQRGSAGEAAPAEKSDATLRKGSLRPINENEAMAPPTLKATPQAPVIEVCVAPKKNPFLTDRIIHSAHSYTPFIFYRHLMSLLPTVKTR